MSKRDRRVYQRYYDLIAEHPGLTTIEYARITPHGVNYHAALQRILSQMEYHGFLLMEGETGALWPYKIIMRYPEDLHNDPISHDTQWKRTGTTIEGNPQSQNSKSMRIKERKRTEWWKCATI